MPHAIPPATVLLTVALIGVVGFLAAEQLWLGLRRRGEPLYLWSAAISLDSMVYLLARVGQSVSDDPSAAMLALRAMHTAGLLLVPLGLATIRAGLGRPPRRVVAMAVAATLVMLAVLWLTPTFLGGTAQHRTNLLGQHYWASSPSPWATLLVAYYFSGLGYVVWMLWRGPIRPTERRVASLLTAVLLVAGVNDALINAGFPTFHMLEFALAAVAISLDYILVHRLSAELEDALTSVTHSEAKYRTLIERAPDAILVHRGARFIYANPAAVRYLGYDDAEELVAQPVDMVPSTQPVPRSSRAPTRGAIEMNLRTREGRELTGEVVQLQVTFDDEEATMWRVRDVTELRNMEAHLALSTRMASVGTLAAGVAHEINNPLSYVLTNLQLASKQVSGTDGNGGGASDQLEQLLSDARQGAERVAKIVRDLKTLSRPDDRTVRSVKLADVLESCVSVAWNEIRHRAQLRCELSGDCFVRGNEGRLAQVFLNLLINAAQSIDEGHATDNEIHIRTFRVKGEAKVVAEVSDTGCGVDPVLLARIFEPFVTSKEIGAGTGLGLSICHGIVESLGGVIEVESEVGRGTTFRVILPCAEPDEAPGSVRLSDAHGANQTLRLLVVDDELMIRRSLARALRQHDLTVATGGREAIELCRSEHFDVVLCDLMMPDVTGMDVFAAVCAERPAYASRFVFMTGGAFTARAREFLASVDNLTFDKPLPLEELEQALQQLGARDPSSAA